MHLDGKLSLMVYRDGWMFLLDWFLRLLYGGIDFRIIRLAIFFAHKSWFLPHFAVFISSV
jgi:hypothetical protein